MGHVYATTEQLKAYITSGSFGDARNETLLTLLESSSRAVDAFCDRGSGFGPVVEDRTFTSRGRRLVLEADLDAVTNVSVDGDDLDPEDFEQPDRRHLVSDRFGRHRTIVVSGSWTYPYQVVATGATVDDDPLAADAEALTPSDLTVLAVGQTLIIDEEQVLVAAIGDTTATIVRAQNGTTADAHDLDAPIRRYRYAAEAVDATLRVAQRRWKQRDAGLTGTFDTGLGIPVTSHQDSEVSILRMAVGHLRFAMVG